MNTDILYLAVGALRISICLAGIVLLFWRSGRLSNFLLGLAALGSTIFYFDFSLGIPLRPFMNPHDVYHYYLGSKYAEEVGYRDLYPATMVAEWETHDKEIVFKSLRSMEDYTFVTSRDVIGGAEKFRERFSAERWRAFKRDVEYFHRSIGSTDAWRAVIRDKGYNATPVWSAYAGVLSDQVDTSNRVGMGILLALDPLLLGLMFVIIGRTFGARTALLALVFFGVMFPIAHGHIRGGFLRLDWLVAMMFALCAIRTGRYATAGVFMAFATAARIFPAIFLLGLVAKACWNFWDSRRATPEPATTDSKANVRFAVSFLISGGCLAALALARPGGWEYATQFAQKIALHNGDLVTMRVGYKYLFLGLYGFPPGQWSSVEAAEAAEFVRMQPIWWGLLGLVLASTVVAVRRLRDEEALAFGYVPFFFFAAPTYYYHVVLLVGLFLFLPRVSEGMRYRAGAALMFGVSVSAYVILAFLPLEMMMGYLFSCSLLVVASSMLVHAGFNGPLLERQIIE